ncbi:MAG: hypothetical protein P8M11_01985 [Planctomycetota bacterium]|nr:hypothetical protein [Planctomycetota bacterium]MDG1983314.1 hypothetical protein [Planctomycetota bacterium]
MFDSPLLLVILAGALIMFFSWALEVHRTMREALLELRRVREELELLNRRD